MVKLTICAMFGRTSTVAESAERWELVSPSPLPGWALKLELTDHARTANTTVATAGHFDENPRQAGLTGASGEFADGNADSMQLHERGKQQSSLIPGVVELGEPISRSEGRFEVDASARFLASRKAQERKRNATPYALSKMPFTLRLLKTYKRVDAWAVRSAYQETESLIRLRSRLSCDRNSFQDQGSTPSRT